MKFAFSVTFSAQSCRDPCPYKASWPSCAASDCTYQATAELEYGADVSLVIVAISLSLLLQKHRIVHPNTQEIKSMTQLDSIGTKYLYLEFSDKFMHSA